MRRITLSALILFAGSSLTHAAGIDCEMTFSLKGWSAFYKTAKGEGTITCDNGTSFPVTIQTKGGGITFGKSEIRNGIGKFSEVAKTDDLFGSYAHAEAHAGAVKSSSAQALTKGEVSLALSGTGEGWDVGIDFGKFTIKKK
ncbi:MAG TPA: hypothetical protein VMT33_07555 [Candidatus Bathyarchaeia archaeon]|jgi:hypothetical protein|nr:hypothetical protein [Candidatus Bathyarchaeia archaeon]